MERPYKGHIYSSLIFLKVDPPIRFITLFASLIHVLFVGSNYNMPTVGIGLAECFVELVIRDTKLVEQLRDRIAIYSLRSSNTDRAEPVGSSRCSFLRKVIGRRRSSQRLDREWLQDSFWHGFQGKYPRWQTP